MVIYNRRNQEPKYREKKDNIMVEINSTLSLDEIYTKLRAGIPLDGTTSIKTYATDPNNERLEDNTRTVRIDRDALYNEEEIEVENMDNDYIKRMIARPELFSAYEAFCFNNEKSASYAKFEPVELSTEQLIDQIQGAIGIMPTVRHAQDKNITEMKRMSEAGDRLFINFGIIDNANPYPLIEDIEFYQKLTDYEKRLINESSCHPMKLLEMAKRVKTRNPNAYITIDMINAVEFQNRDINEVAEAFTAPFLNYSGEEEQTRRYGGGRKDSYKVRANEAFTNEKDISMVQYMYQNIQGTSAHSSVAFDVGAIGLPTPDVFKAIANPSAYSKEVTDQFPSREVMSDFLKALYSERVIPEGILDDFPNFKDRIVRDYSTFLVAEWNKFKEISEINFDTYRSEDAAAFIQFAKDEYTRPVSKRMKTLSDMFVKEFKRAPKILEDYAYAQDLATHNASLYDAPWTSKNTIANDMHKSSRAQGTQKLRYSKDEKYLESIVKGFNLKNIQLIAKYRNPVLFALAPYVSFGNIKKDIIDCLATEISVYDINKLIDRGFPQWLAAHTDTPVADLSRMLSVVTYEPTGRYDEATDIETIKYDPKLTAKEIADDTILIRARKDCEAYEKAYHYKFKDNEIAIRGRNISVTNGKQKMYMLPADDLRNFTIGYDTHCCQHWGGAGSSCVPKYTRDPFAAGVVIEQAGKVVGQAFVWTDEIQDTFVFDNMEFANNASVKNYASLISAYVKALPYKTVHCGAGYLDGGMNQWGKQIGDSKDDICAKMPMTVDDKMPYTDYHTHKDTGYGAKARVFKRDGTLLLKEPSGVKVHIKEDEPTRWDILRDPEVAFLLNDSSTPIEERIEFANKFKNDPDGQTQMYAVTKNPMAIKSIENPIPDVQIYVVRRNPEYARYIQNPCPQVQEELIAADPASIQRIQNPTEGMQLAAVNADGNLIKYIKEPTERVCVKAVENNGYAIEYIAPDRQTLAVKRAAVQSDPKVVTIMGTVEEELYSEAINRDPHVIALIPSPSERIQVLAVTKDASAIQDIKEPCQEAINIAVKKNGNFIRNFSRQADTSLRTDAIKQNPFSVTKMKDATFEEYVLAVSLNKNVSRFIKDKELKARVTVEVESQKDARQAEPEQEIVLD